MMGRLLYLALFITLPILGFAQNNNLKGKTLKIAQKSKLIGDVTVGSSSFESSSALTVTATDQGMLVPRMNTAARDNIANPVEGLLIYNTQTAQFEFFDVTWQAVGGGGNTIYSADDNLAGNRTVTMGANGLAFEGNLTTFKGINASGAQFSILTTDDSDVPTFRVANNGVNYLAGIINGHTEISKGAGIRVFNASGVEQSRLGLLGNLELRNASAVLVHNLNTGTNSQLQNNGVNLGIGADAGSPTARLFVTGTNAASTSDALTITDNALTVLLRVENGGDVGINNPDPTAKLHVIGDMIVDSIFSIPTKPLTLGVAATTFIVQGNKMEITGDGGANSVTTITGGIDGMTLTLTFVDALVTLTDNNTSALNTINLPASFTSTANDIVVLEFKSGSWRQVSQSVN